MNHCDQKDVPEGTYANFNSMATLHYTVMVDREAIGDEAALNTFMRESLAIVHTPDFYTLLQAGILESGASPDHEGSKIGWDMSPNGRKWTKGGWFGDKFDDNWTMYMFIGHKYTSGRQDKEGCLATEILIKNY